MLKAICNQINNAYKYGFALEFLVIFLSQGTEALLLREANLKDEDIQAETATQSASDVSRALAAYKRSMNHNIGTGVLSSVAYRSTVCELPACL